jgi:hypothetical protein
MDPFVFIVLIFVGLAALVVYVKEQHRNTPLSKVDEPLPNFRVIGGLEQLDEWAAKRQQQLREERARYEAIRRLARQRLSEPIPPGDDKADVEANHEKLRSSSEGPA